MSAIIIDTETTCAEGPIEVIEMYWETFDFDLQPANGMYQRYAPTGEIQLGAVATHHIFAEDLIGCPPSPRAPADVPPVDYWIGHKIDFDWKALGSPRGVKRICTMAMARATWPQIDKHTLTALTYFISGRTPQVRHQLQSAHGARTDVALCRNILMWFFQHEEGLDSLEKLYQFSEYCRIPKIMAFGKYKGQPVSAVDKGWANWYARQDDTDEYLLKALRLAGKL